MLLKLILSNFATRKTRLALTVAAVARQVGYRSEVAFAAAFKRDGGTSPGAYRKAPQA